MLRSAPAIAVIIVTAACEARAVALSCKPLISKAVIESGPLLNYIVIRCFREIGKTDALPGPARAGPGRGWTRRDQLWLPAEPLFFAPTGEGTQKI